MIFSFQYLPVVESNTKAKFIEATENKEFAESFFKAIESIYFVAFKECVYTWHQRMAAINKSIIILQNEINLFHIKESNDGTYNIFRCIRNKQDINVYDNLRQLFLYAKESQDYESFKSLDQSKETNDGYFQRLINNLYDSIYNIVCSRMVDILDRELQEITSPTSSNRNAASSNNEKVINEKLNELANVTKLSSAEVLAFKQLLIDKKLPIDRIPWKLSISCLKQSLVELSPQKFQLGNHSLNEFIIQYFSPRERKGIKKKNRFNSNQIDSSKPSAKSEKQVEIIVGIFMSFSAE